MLISYGNRGAYLEVIQGDGCASIIYSASSLLTCDLWALHLSLVVVLSNCSGPSTNIVIECFNM